MDLDPKLFIFSHFFSCAFFYDFHRLLGTKTTCSASYGKRKTAVTNQPAPGKKRSTQVPIV